MKVAILAGGLGTRLQEETTTIPKPLVEVGGRPLLWHIMKIYSAYGYNDFVVALGYKADVVKDYFMRYSMRGSDVTVNLRAGEVKVSQNDCEDWTIQLLDTGLETLTGGRVKRVAQCIGRERFMLTYGDGVANIDINALLQFHEKHQRIATVTAVRPPARFGEITFKGEAIAILKEKPQSSEGWVNGGFFVFEPEIVDYIDGDSDILEKEPLMRLSQEGQLAAYRHYLFWQCMDTLRDVRLLESLWNEPPAPWKVWTD